ncbi:uncharacterized protein AKAME5_001972500 [Lates japonicus]|uniref:Uncharacterized protein n=1 Tax=Lates japonicus TaxID=270547 RepID=A0AAD3N5Z6_LATJO|nr:uncharacterized protein AKAME5_001972500 [Lates japonicus]
MSTTTTTTTTTAALGLRALLGRLQLLRTSDWRSGVRRAEGKRKRCARKQKRGKRGGLLAKLKAKAGRPPVLGYIKEKKITNSGKSNNFW